MLEQDSNKQVISTDTTDKSTASLSSAYTSAESSLGPSTSSSSDSLSAADTILNSEDRMVTPSTSFSLTKESNDEFKYRRHSYSPLKSASSENLLIQQEIAAAIRESNESELKSLESNPEADQSKQKIDAAVASLLNDLNKSPIITNSRHSGNFQEPGAQSLPHFSPSQQSPLKKELSESNLYKLNIQDIKKQTIGEVAESQVNLDTVENNPSPVIELASATIQLDEAKVSNDLSESNTVKATTESSPPEPQRKSSSIFSMFEKILAKSMSKSASSTSIKSSTSGNIMTTSPSASSISQTSAGNELESKEKEEATAASPQAQSNTSTASSSSPNPNCSPYKLLMNEIPSSNVNVNNCNMAATTLSPNGSTIHEAVAIFNAAHKLDQSEKIMESLAELNPKEHEKADPILSASVSSNAVPSFSANENSESKSNQNEELNKVDSEPVQSSTVSTDAKKDSSSHLTDIPASSQEFCMNLNFNLASAAAVNACAPLVVVQNPPSCSSSEDLHRFTSNASTSSIHNDLKMILEEGKDSKIQFNQQQTQQQMTVEPVKAEHNQQYDQQMAPKPQRVNHPHKNRHHHQQQNEQKEMNNSQGSKLSSTSSSEQLSETSMIKALMSLVDRNKSMKQHDSKLRYTKDFLFDVRDHRSELIRQICPEIFKEYYQCMNGKYWDPEKFFDIIQFPNDYEKMQGKQQHGPYNRKHRVPASSTSYPRLNNSNTSDSMQHFNDRKKSNENLKPLNQQRVVKSLTTNDLYPDESSPQHLQVPANSPKSIQVENPNTDQVSPSSVNKKKSKSSKNKHNKSLENKENKKKSNNVLSKLGLLSVSSASSNSSNLSFEHDKQSYAKTSDADQILLSLIKKDSQPKQQSAINNCEVNLLNLINNKPATPSPSTENSKNILDNLFNLNKEVSPNTNNIISSLSSVLSQNSQHAFQPSHHAPVLFTAQELEMAQLSDNAKLPLRVADLSYNKQPMYVNNDLAISDDSSDAYKQLVKNLTSHPLYTSNASTKNFTVNDVLSKLKPKTNTPTVPVSENLAESTNILKQMLNLNTDKNEKKNKSSKRSHHKSKSVKDNNNNNTKEKLKFPAVDPHEKPFQTYLTGQEKQTCTNPIENLLKQMQSQSKPCEVKTNDADHFNSLLSKIMPQQPQPQLQQTSPKVEDGSSNILKWFSANPNPNNMNVLKNSPNSAQTLSEIEFMQTQRPLLQNY